MVPPQQYAEFAWASCFESRFTLVYLARFQWNIYCVPCVIPLHTFSFFACLHFLHWHVHRDPRRTRACLDCSINRCSLDLGPARHIWNLYKFHVLCPPLSLQPESVVRIPATISIWMCLMYLCIILWIWNSPLLSFCSYWNGQNTNTVTNILQPSEQFCKSEKGKLCHLSEFCRNLSGYIFINLDKGGLVPELSEPAAAKSNRNGGWSWGKFIAERQGPVSTGSLTPSSWSSSASVGHGQILSRRKVPFLSVHQHQHHLQHHLQPRPHASVSLGQIYSKSKVPLLIVVISNNNINIISQIFNAIINLTLMVIEVSVLGQIYGWTRCLSS